MLHRTGLIGEPSFSSSCSLVFQRNLNRVSFVHPTQIHLEQPSSSCLFQHVTNMELVLICFTSISTFPSSLPLFGWHSYRKGRSQLLTRFPQPIIQDSSYKDGIRVALEHLLQSCNHIYAGKLFWKAPGFLGSHLFEQGPRQ